MDVRAFTFCQVYLCKFPVSRLTQFFRRPYEFFQKKNKYSLSFQPSRILSAFEESSAACISDMLRQVSNGAYLDALRMAEKFILHVEVLFGTIDDLEWVFAERGFKGVFLYSFNFIHSCSSFLPPSLFLIQGCPTFAKPACSAEKQSTFSPSYPTRRKRDHGGWA